MPIFSPRFLVPVENPVQKGLPTGSKKGFSSSDSKIYVLNNRE